MVLINFIEILKYFIIYLICKCLIILVIINNNINLIDVNLDSKIMYIFLEIYFVFLFSKEVLFLKFNIEIWRWRKFLRDDRGW